MTLPQQRYFELHVIANRLGIDIDHIVGRSDIRSNGKRYVHIWYVDGDALERVFFDAQTLKPTNFDENVNH